MRAQRTGRKLPKRRSARHGSTAMWKEILAPLDRGDVPLYAQLEHAFVSAIESSKIAAGLRVPSGRELGRMLGIGRNTATLAISNLVERGYMVARSRSGVFIAQRKITPEPDRTLGLPRSEPVWAARLEPLREFDHHDASTNTLSGGDIDFRFGQFDLELFPTGDWRECEKAALTVSDIADWGRDMVDSDDAQLIDCLRRYVLPERGIWASTDEIIITLGGQEGRYLVAQLLCRPGIRVGIEDPGVPDMRRIVRRTGAELCFLAVDPEGVVCESGLGNCSVLFATPGHHCPTTAIMSLERRQQLLRHARDADVVIVEDTYDFELLGEGLLPSLYSLDRGQRVIHIGSLSKLIAPGLRLGYVVAAAPVVRHLRELRRLIHRHPPGNNQRALAILLQRGFYRAFLGRATQQLRARTMILEAALSRYFPDFTWRHQDNAASFWVSAPEDFDAERFAAAGAKIGVLIESGQRFFASAQPPRNHFRMAVSAVRDRDIEVGIARLAEARRRMT